MFITFFDTGLGHVINGIIVIGFNPASPVFIELTIKKDHFLLFLIDDTRIFSEIRGRLNNKAVYSQEKHAFNIPVLTLLAVITISYHYLVAILAGDILNSLNNLV
ncbi:Uncharacterised protein [Streptococcus pneumoniae]|nr:Uncharacterised protein [Streptococcus pneumoniae]